MQGCKMDCENCDNCELRLRKKHNFANNTIQFFECRSQSQHKLCYITQFDFPEDRNCESCENYYIRNFANNTIGF